MLFEIVVLGTLYAGVKAYEINKKNPSFSVNNAKAAFQKFKEERIKPLLEKERKLKTEVLMNPSDEPEINDEKEIVKQNLAISSLSLGITTTGILLFSKPLLALGVVPAVIATVPIYRRAYHSLFKEGEIGVAVLDSATFTIAIITHQYFAVALAPFCYYYSRKVLMQRESEAAESLTVPFEQPNNLVLIDGSEVAVSINSLMKGEVITVNAGESIPVDGSITSGQALVDERNLTGNVLPTEKKVGEQVFASTVVVTGCISVIVENKASETIAAQVSQILTSTAESRKSLRQAGEKIADILVFSTAMVGFLAYPFLGLVSMGNIFNADLAYQMSALGPIGLLNYLKVATEKGILVKNAQALTLLNLVNSVVLEADALLEELPYIAKIHTYLEISQDDLLGSAAAVYKKGDSITLALRKFADKHKVSVPNVGDAKLEMEDGVRAKLSGMMIRVGNLSFMEKERIVIPGEVRTQFEVAKVSGGTLLLIAIDANLSGAIELHPTIRPEAQVVIQELKERHLLPMIISTRSEEATRKIAQELHINDYFAELSAQERVYLFEQFLKDGKVTCYVGDHIENQQVLNMTLSSISLRGTKDLVTNNAHVILMDQSLKQLVEVFEIANGLASNVSSNFIATTIPGILGVSGTILFGLGLIPSIIINHIGLGIGYLNTMQPLNAIEPETIESTVSRPSNFNRKRLTLNKQTN